MKLKLKHLAAAMGLALVAAPSFADIITPTTGDGELILVAYGTAKAGGTDASYTLDLGVLNSAFLASPSLSATVSGANWDAFTNAVDLSTANWAVFGGKNTGVSVGARNLLSTVQVGQESAAGTLTSSNLTLALGELYAYESLVNQGGTHTTLANGDSFDPKGSLGYFQALNGNSLNTKLPYSAGNLIGTTSEFTNLIRSTGSTPVTESVFPGTLSFANVGGVYTLSYGAVAAVPEPSGVVLALSAFGVLGIARRRRAGRPA